VITISATGAVWEFSRGLLCIERLSSAMLPREKEETPGMLPVCECERLRKMLSWFTWSPEMSEGPWGVTMVWLDAVTVVVKFGWI
jgi:hypothetical protein